MCDMMLVETAFNAAYCLKVITDISAIDITVNIPLYTLACGLTFFPFSLSLFLSLTCAFSLACLMVKSNSDLVSMHYILFTSQ